MYLRAFIERYLLVVTLVVLVSAVLISLVFAQQTHRNVFLLSRERSVGIINEFVAPALNASDYLEVQRILSVSSNDQEFFSVVTNYGDILLSDYSNIDDVRAVVESQTDDSDVCSQVDGELFEFDGFQWLCGCRTLTLKNQLTLADEPIGLLLSFSRSYPLFSGVTQIFIVLGSALGVLLLGTIAFIRLQIRRKVVEPIERFLFNLGHRDANSSVEWEIGKDIPVEIQELASHFFRLLIKQRENFERQRKLEADAAEASLARQVAHDIRSPLAALEFVSRSTSEISEDTRNLLRLTISRIREIGSQLEVKRSRQIAIPSDPREWSLKFLLDLIVSEKKAELRGHGKRCDLTVFWNDVDEPSELFVRVDKTAFFVALSNLINNAVEACGELVRVALNISLVHNGVRITITDRGTGIDPKSIHFLGNKGFSEKNGQGLGLFHAKNCVESWGGQLSVSSTTGEGTSVNIDLPLQPIPPWHCSEIEVSDGQYLVICDDDRSVHEVWKELTRSKGSQIKLVHCRDWTEAERASDSLKSRSARATWLLDYEIRGSKLSGVDFATKLRLTDSAIIVTGRAHEEKVLDECIRSGLKVIAKSNASHLRFVQSSH